MSLWDIWERVFHFDVTHEMSLWNIGKSFLFRCYPQNVFMLHREEFLFRCYPRNVLLEHREEFLISGYLQDVPMEHRGFTDNSDCPTSHRDVSWVASKGVNVQSVP